MGREIRRVALDFDAPLGKEWAGYDMPEHLRADDCLTCDGSGNGPHVRYLTDMWNGRIPFRAALTGSTPFTIDHPQIRAFAERQIERTPEFYGTGEHAIRREAERIAALINGRWSNHLGEEDVAALLAHGGNDLRHWTHDWTRETGWQPKAEPVVPTAAQVNERNLFNYNFGSLEEAIVIRARCAKIGAELACPDCKGDGRVEAYPGQAAEAEAWKPTEPPEGPGFQLWQTVSDGPISPVFEDGDALIDWMTSPAAAWGASGPWSREHAIAFVRGDGWAPSFIGVGGRVVDGVTAVGSAPRALEA